MGNAINVAKVDIKWKTVEIRDKSKIIIIIEVVKVRAQEAIQKEEKEKRKDRQALQGVVRAPILKEIRKIIENTVLIKKAQKKI